MFKLFVIVMLICILAAVSGCASRGCSDVEYLGNSLCK